MTAPIAVVIVRILYLGADAQHLQRRRHIDLVRDADMPEVNGESLAPHAKVSDVEHGQITGQSQDDGLFVVASKRSFFAVLVRDADALGGGFCSAANPEFCVYGGKLKTELT